MMTRRAVLVLAALGALIAAPVQAAERFIVVQSTTSTANSGLFDAILPKFTEKTGITVKVVAVGTGQALKNAENGDGDVVLVHSRKAEDAFVASGFGVKRYDVMYNDYVLVGPASDPAQIKGIRSAAEAFGKIAAAKAPFASRGDDSGTHKAELELWKAASLDPRGAQNSWCRETGSGMGATLNTAVAMGAYALADRGTWASFQNRGTHAIVVEGDAKLFNPYGVILVNPARHPNVKAADGQAFIDWLIGAEGQAAIAAFTVGGEPLFFPSAQPALTR